MTPKQLKSLLHSAHLELSGLEERHYLGLSQAGNCPRKIYFDLTAGRRLSTQLHYFTYLGNMFEEDTKGLLRHGDAALLSNEQKELSAFDGRVLGHIDGTWDGDLLEIKSTTEDKIKMVQAKGPFQSHRMQCQAYMHFYDLRQAHLIYRARDTGLIWVEGLRYKKSEGNNIERKVARILDAIDARRPPACECGWCRS